MENLSRIDRYNASKGGSNVEFMQRVTLDTLYRRAIEHLVNARDYKTDDTTGPFDAALNAAMEILVILLPHVLYQRLEGMRIGYPMGKTPQQRYDRVVEMLELVRHWETQSVNEYYRPKED